MSQRVKELQYILTQINSGFLPYNQDIRVKEYNFIKKPKEFKTLHPNHNLPNDFVGTARDVIGWYRFLKYGNDTYKIDLEKDWGIKNYELYQLSGSDTTFQQQVNVLNRMKKEDNMLDYSLKDGENPFRLEWDYDPNEKIITWCEIDLDTYYLLCQMQEDDKDAWTWSVSKEDDEDGVIPLMEGQTSSMYKARKLCEEYYLKEVKGNNDN